MTYIVTRPHPKKEKLTFEEVLFGVVDEKRIAKLNYNGPVTGTKTYQFDCDTIPQNIKKIMDIESDIEMMEGFYRSFQYMDIFFNDKYNYRKQLKIQSEIEREILLKNEVDKYDYTEKNRIITERTTEKLAEIGLELNPYYNTFWIPKKSGSGLRQIDAPTENLKAALTQLKIMFERFMNYNTYHTSAYAYIQKRCTVDLVKKLQYNKSRWILKLDFSNFFGSVNMDFTMKQLSKIFPFSEYVKTDRGKTALYNCLKLCFLDGHLPQGTPISPLLTNIIMIPIDFKLSNAFYKQATEITEFDKADDDRQYRLIYTRYADDIFIGAHRGFRYKNVLQYIDQVLKEEDAPFAVKPEKTRYGSTAGKNWILGLMYNQDGNITIGHKKKKQIEAMIHNFAMDYVNGKSLHANDVQAVLGNISYFASIENDYAMQIIQKYNKKFCFDVIKTMKECISNVE